MPLHDPAGSAALRARASLLRRLSDPAPLVAVELRPPRSGLEFSEGMDVWIDMYHSIQRLARQDSYVLLTDNAVGTREEENLSHLSANLGGEVDFGHLIPFLTCKHSLDYCLMYGERAAVEGIQALTVVGGDRSVGRERCVPHASDLRTLLRGRVPSLALGGWANTHRDPIEQVGYIADADFNADYLFTQVVSHHDLPAVEAFLTELQRRNIQLPLAVGVFYYRSANPRTLETLNEFLPVPAEALTREFDSGASPEEICARTIRALRSLGVKNVYLSNLGVRRVEQVWERILQTV